MKIVLPAFALLGFLTGNVGRTAMTEARAAEKPESEPLYAERYRPQFHFTPRINWTNDPNGLVFYKGEYHLFFQHNPTGINWGNMTWGHAVSLDLLHWQQLDHAIHPDKLGTIYSGSAVVDWDNTAGFQTGPEKTGTEKTIVCIYTSAGKPFTQSIAYSNDRGRTWKKYEGNPVLKHIAGENRDPKVFWHVPSKRWIMALYLDGNDYALFSSPDLKTWTKLCDVRVPGSSECPDFFALPVDGDAANVKWVFWTANNRYRLGDFDGKNFRAETEPLATHFGANRYAAQTYSDIPPDRSGAADGRRIQIAWMAGGKYPDMPFNQQMSIPAELTLRTFPEGVRLCTLPVREVEQLRQGVKLSFAGELKPGENPLKNLRGELWDVALKVEPRAAEAITLNVRGTPIQFDVKTRKLSCLGSTATIELIDGCLALRVLVDRASIEIFTADGRANMAFCFLPPQDNQTLALSCGGGTAKIKRLDVWPMASTWPKAKP